MELRRRKRDKDEGDTEVMTRKEFLRRYDIDEDIRKLDTVEDLCRFSGGTLVNNEDGSRSCIIRKGMSNKLEGVTIDIPIEIKEE